MFTDNVGVWKHWYYNIPFFSEFEKAKPSFELVQVII